MKKLLRIENILKRFLHLENISDLHFFLTTPFNPSLFTTAFIFDWQYHPDRQSADAPAGAVEECVQKFIEIEQAWKILGNEETKKEYDLLRHEDHLRNMGPVDAQVYLEEMSWNEDDHSFSLSCRCGGKYRVSKDEAEEVTLISCDTCSLIIELLHYS
ncbi:PREDICTED: dnaJ homolog subfamily C member 24 [Ceratotherium simum simum]|uniref:DnaJ homolog subfamily C member 24 n=1 Tax=Ceratotherium simum simum TaxID=73337 RepID=A0ABM1CUQ8_CERSS|nr:PREDICTED: dnaJ homolog subfamily C member 24 [Ceratotherium simum simum]